MFNCLYKPFHIQLNHVFQFQQQQQQQQNMSFESFFQGWLDRQEELLDELLSAPREGEEHKLRELIEKALTHYGAYYREKSLMASRDVLLVFSPRWFTACERTFLWIAGWKPGMAFRLVRSNVEGLTVEQSEAIGQLREGTAAREEELAAEMTMVQEASVLGINLGPRRWRRNGFALRDGEAVETAAEAMEVVTGRMESLLGLADSLRKKTVMDLVGMLEPLQVVDLLAAATQLHIHLRRWGLQRDSGTA